MKRSDKTEIRRLRQTLRNARATIAHMLTVSVPTQWDHQLMRDTKWEINDRLAPKRARRTP